jgi:hypothetical protein
MEERAQGCSGKLPAQEFVPRSPGLGPAPQADAAAGPSSTRTGPHQAEPVRASMRSEEHCPNKLTGTPRQ